MSGLPAFPRRGLYALTPDDGATLATLIARVSAAIDGGTAVVQYRDKRAAPAARRACAGAVVEHCHARGVPLIVNDDVELAAAIGAAGVHLGRDDGTVAAARTRLGPQRIVGVSCYDSVERALEAADAGADYVAFGSCYPSATKPRAIRCGVEVLAAAAAELTLPIVAIGGITPENAGPLLAAGAGLVAVIGALFDGDDPAAAARAFARLFCS